MASASELPTNPEALRQGLDPEEQSRRISIINAAKSNNGNWYEFAKYRFVAYRPEVPNLSSLTDFQVVRGLPFVHRVTSWPRSENVPEGKRVYTHDWWLCFTEDEVIDAEVGVAYGAIVAGIGKLATAGLESYETITLQKDISMLTTANDPKGYV